MAGPVGPDLSYGVGSLRGTVPSSGGMWRGNFPSRDVIYLMGTVLLPGGIYEYYDDLTNPMAGSVWGTRLSHDVDLSAKLTSTLKAIYEEKVTWSTI